MVPSSGARWFHRPGSGGRIKTAWHQALARPSSKAAIIASAQNLGIDMCVII